MSVSEQKAKGSMTDAVFEIFLATAPGLEEALCAEVRGKGFKRPKAIAGGVVFQGGWPEVWRANLWIRGATRVLARLASARVLHMAQLERWVRSLPWGDVLRADVSFRVEAVCKKSRIYHSGAVVARIEAGIAAALGGSVAADLAADADGAAGVLVMARIEHDICTISIDTSGDLLHRRGYKEAVNAAPMRETMAALFLLQCGYDGREPVVDPMCGSGTFVIEAAEIAARLNPGRARSFAFETFANFDADAWARMRSVQRAGACDMRFYGSDRDAGAVAMSRANAARAGVADLTVFRQTAISDLVAPEGPPGLVILNPPYGARLGDKKSLFPLYAAIGKTLLARFSGWRVGLIASEESLARATKLPFLPVAAPVQHGGLRVTLFQTSALP